MVEVRTRLSLSTPKNIKDNLNFDKLAGTDARLGKLLTLCPRVSLFQPLRALQLHAEQLKLQQVEGGGAAGGEPAHADAIIAWLRKTLQRGYRGNADFGRMQLLKKSFMSFTQFMSHAVEPFNSVLTENRCFILDEVHEMLNKKKIKNGDLNAMLRVFQCITSLRHVKVFTLSGTPGADIPELLFMIHMLKGPGQRVSSAALEGQPDAIAAYCRDCISFVEGARNKRQFADEAPLRVVELELSQRQYNFVAKHYEKHIKGDMAEYVAAVDAERGSSGAGADALKAASRLSTYGTLWWGARGRGTLGLANEVCDDTERLCGIELCGIAAKVTAFARFALRPAVADDAPALDPRHVKHFVYARSGPTVSHFAESLGCACPPRCTPRRVPCACTHLRSGISLPDCNAWTRFCAQVHRSERCSGCTAAEAVPGISV
jgi:hypothetical protein